MEGRERVNFMRGEVTRVASTFCPVSEGEAKSVKRVQQIQLSFVWPRG